MSTNFQVLVENGDGLMTSSGPAIACGNYDVTQDARYNASTHIAVIFSEFQTINVQHQEGAATMSQWNGTTFIEVAQPPTPNDLKPVTLGDLKTVASTLAASSDGNDAIDALITEVDS